MGKTSGKFKRPRLAEESGVELGEWWGGGEACVMTPSLPTGRFENLTCIKWQKAAKQPFEFNGVFDELARSR
jgi:hypothetical protein